MSVNVTASAFQYYNLFIKLVTIAFNLERTFTLNLPSALPVPTSFPPDWNPSNYSSGGSYAIAHPLNQAMIGLSITSPPQYGLSSKYLDSPYPHYSFGRVLLGAATGLTTMSVRQIAYPQYSPIILFDGKIFSLNYQNDFSAISAIAVDFFIPLSGELLLILPLQFP